MIDAAVYFEFFEYLPAQTTFGQHSPDRCFDHAVRMLTKLLAQGMEIEKTGQPARPEVLEEMARVSKGRVIQPAQLGELVKEINALPEPRPLESRIPLWSHWGTLTALIVLLGTFWAGRKLNGAF